MTIPSILNRAMRPFVILTLLTQALIAADSASAPQSFDPGIYVSFTSGDDNNTGLTPNDPWKTFDNFAGVVLVPGTGVYLKRGDVWANRKLVLNGKGIPGSPIRLSAYGEGHPPVITGINLINEACVVWNNPSHVRIDSLHCRDAKIGIYLRFTGGSTDGTGEMFNNQDVHITNCYFENMDEKWSDVDGVITVVPPFELSWGAGIWLGGTIPAFGGPWPSEFTLILNDFSVTHCGFKDVNTGLGNGFYFPRSFRSRFTNFRFEDSWVTGCENGAFALFFVDGGHAKRIDTWLGGEEFYATGTTGGFIQSSQNFLIEDCQFAGNIRPATSADGVGFDIEGDCSNVIVRDCVIHDNDGAGFLVLNTGGFNDNLVLENLTIWNNCRNPRQGDRDQNAEMRYAGNPSPPNPSSYGQLTNTGIYLGTDVGVGDAAGFLSHFDVPGDWITDFSPVNVRTTVPWSAIASRPVSWEFAGSAEGWGNTKDWAGFAVVDGALTGTSSGNDCYVESADTWVNSRVYNWIRVRMSSTSGDTAQVFFQTETQPFFSADKSVPFPVIPDGQMREYWVPLWNTPTFRGVVTKWRLDPTIEVGSQIRVDSVGAGLEPLIASISVVSPTAVDLTFSQPMAPAGGVFDPSQYTLDGLGRGSVSVNPDFVSLISTPAGPVYRLSWNSGSMNGLDAVLSFGNPTNVRGAPLYNGSLAFFTSIPRVDPDRDFDGMPDGWETAFSFNPDFAGDASLDADFDGHSNLNEFLANTDPRNPLSFLRVTRFAFPAPDELFLTWDSTPGMTYDVETSTDLVNWFPAGFGPVASTGSETSAFISPYDAKLYIRVIARRPNPLLGTP